jgi:hypothetical protein
MKTNKTPDSTAPLSKNGLTPLTQEELKAWWPFERLDPKRFPKQNEAAKLSPVSDVEDALF